MMKEERTDISYSSMEQYEWQVEGEEEDASQSTANEEKQNNSINSCSSLNGYSSDWSAGGSSEKPVMVVTKRPRKRRRRGRKNKASQSSATTTPPKVEEEIPEEEKEKYVAMDCEMVGVGYGGHKSALARVCIINFHREILLDTFVRVYEPVTDYRTFVSGITAAHVTSDFAMPYRDCRLAVQNILRGKILVGHALKNDLHCLRLSHPWHSTRDTAKYEPFMKCRFDDGVLWPRKLKDLTMERLQRCIQPDGLHHCPFEDANAALDLYLNVRRKWEKVMDYKIRKTQEIRALQKQHYQQQQQQLQRLQHLIEPDGITPMTTVQVQ